MSNAGDCRCQTNEVKRRRYVHMFGWLLFLELSRGPGCVINIVGVEGCRFCAVAEIEGPVVPFCRQVGTLSGRQCGELSELTQSLIFTNLLCDPANTR